MTKALLCCTFIFQYSLSFTLYKLSLFIFVLDNVLVIMKLDSCESTIYGKNAAEQKVGNYTSSVEYALLQMNNRRMVASAPFWKGSSPVDNFCFKNPVSAASFSLCLLSNSVGGIQCHTNVMQTFLLARWYSHNSPPLACCSVGSPNPLEWIWGRPHCSWRSPCADVRSCTELVESDPMSLKIKPCSGAIGWNGCQPDSGRRCLLAPPQAAFTSNVGKKLCPCIFFPCMEKSTWGGTFRGNNLLNIAKEAVSSQQPLDHKAPLLHANWTYCNTFLGDSSLWK